MNPTGPETGAPDGAVPASGSGRRSRSAPKSGNGNDRSGNEPERPGTTGGLFESLADFLDRTAKLPPPSWLLEPLVPDAGRLFMVSAPNAGKTFLALVIAKAAARA